jgi:pseudaminic acid synthase
MEIEIGGRKIGPGYPAFIIAEMSSNHLGNFDRAVEIIKQAKKAGADAIKLQTYTPDTMTIECDNSLFTLPEGTIWGGRTYYDLYREAQTPWGWHHALKKIAEQEDLIFFSTPFNKKAVDFLEELGVPAYKIASFETLDIPLVEYAASMGKPMIISTGIATIGEIDHAVAACRRAGNRQIVLLKCTSSYPAPYEDMNLTTIPNMSEVFGIPCGISDHTNGIAVPICAVALGACIIEKHLTLRRDEGGPDAAFSLEPEEFAEMVAAVRIAEAAIGTVSYSLSERTRLNRVFARSLFIVRDMKAGETFTEENLRSIRPGYGLPARYLRNILGRRARTDIARGSPLKPFMIDLTEK